MIPSTYFDNFDLHECNNSMKELPLKVHLVTFTNVELNSPEEHVEYVLSTLIP